MVMLNIVSTVALILSLLGQFLVAKKNKAAFPIWIVSNTCWIVVNFMQIPNYQQIVMYVVYCIINAYSWYCWIKDEKKKDKE